MQIGIALKKWLYVIFVRNEVVRFISHPLLSVVVPPVVGLYYGTLDIWGDEWGWVKDKKEIHELLFSVLAAGTVLILFLKGARESVEANVSKKYQILTESILQFFNSLVKKKRDRFFNKARSLRPTADIFNIITQPKDQLEHVLDGTKTFLVNGFKISQKNIGITIIQGNPEDNKWWYALKCDAQKQHTKPKDLMKEGSNSTARYCYESGDSLFIADIRKGIKDGVFFESARSKASSIGSIFCKPVRIHVGAIDYVYIFTIAVFGQHICTPHDEDECVACEKILDEVADRVELELYLFSIKQYRDSGGKAA